MKFFIRNVKVLLLISNLVINITAAADFNAQKAKPNREEWAQDDPRWETLISDFWRKNFVSPTGPVEETTQNFWNSKAQDALQQKLNSRLNYNRAKNVVIMVGDGMGLSSLMAARSYLEDVSAELSFEKFPFSGLSKTYCVNYQVADSACSATAIMRGVKANYGVIGLAANVEFGNCTESLKEISRPQSIFKYAQDAGKSTGIVTNMRVTHPTPAAAYAWSPSRFHENDVKTPPECEDIGKQLVHGPVGSKLDVTLGGGLANLVPETSGGKRKDGMNLVEDFKKKHKRSFVAYNRTELKSVNPQETDKLLGLFAKSHMDFKLLADEETQPTLTEMTAKALEILKRNEEHGFVLLVEGGQIDDAHHKNLAHLALEEVVEFHKAVHYVKKNTNEEDTLVIVTADHSHSFYVSGNIARGRNILGPGDYSFYEDKWIFAVGYVKGPSYSDHYDITNGQRISPKGMRYMEPKFRHPSAIPSASDDFTPHSGEDVGVYASGPYSHLFSGVYEQNFIAHAAMYASCLGPDDVLKNPKCGDKANEI